MRKFGFAALTAAFVFTAASAEPQVIPVWNGVAPGSESWAYNEEHEISAADSSLNIRNIVHPTLTVYLPPTGTANGTGVIVAPGGAFINLGYGKEGEEVARWLNSLGVTAFVLKYRLARNDEKIQRYDPALAARINADIPLAVADGKQAMRIVRARAGAWGLKYIGVIGFSAGGYVTNTAALEYGADNRPDFAVSLYSGMPHEITAPADAPPLFIAQASDDRYGPDGSLRLYSTWTKAHIPVELHLYAKGDHGFALRKHGIPTDTWNARLADWMMQFGFLPKAE
jgi:acetyl esterase/lipase